MMVLAVDQGVLDNAYWAVLYVGGSHCLLIATHPGPDIETIHFEGTIAGDLYVTLGACILWNVVLLALIAIRDGRTVLPVATLSTDLTSQGP